MGHTYEMGITIITPQLKKNMSGYVSIQSAERLKCMRYYHNPPDSCVIVWVVKGMVRIMDASEQDQNEIVHFQQRKV